MGRWARAVIALVAVAAAGGASHATDGGIAAAESEQASGAPIVYRYPLRVGPTRRYLVDRNGRPFLIVGDSPQALMAKVSPSDADRFFADRAAKGFNAVWVNLLCNNYTGGAADGTTYDGIAPFTTPEDLSKPNEKYFRRADVMIRTAAKHGIVVFLDPIETGGWLKVLRKNGVAKAFAYGKWLGKRYRTFPNIVWFSGNDFQQWRDAANAAVVLAVARGIKATDRQHIHTVELDFPGSGSRDDPRWTPVIGLDAAYTYFPTYAQVLKEYNRPDFIPTFMVEANYEFEHDYKGPETLRRQEYWTLLSGATGQLYGNKFTWQFIDDWKNHLDTTGVAELQYATRLFSNRPWFNLVPDQDHQLVTAGFGTFSSTANLNENDYVTAARTPNGGLAIAYLPTRHPVTVDLSRITGRVTAQWYDPTTGRYTAVAGSPLANSGTRDFAPTRSNASGDDDWVLVLTGS